MATAMALPATLPSAGTLRVVPPAVLDRALEKQAQEKAAALTAVSAATSSNLASYIRTEFEAMRNHRNSQSGWSERLLSALRSFNGQYDASKLAEIKKFGGSDVYARITAMKCRGASSLLRDVYLTPDKPWGIMPPADPDIPPEVMANIKQLVWSELATMQMAGQPVEPMLIRERVMQLTDAAKEAAKKQAGKLARMAEDKIEEILGEGGFYKALAEFLVDLPLFPFACIKGPVVRVVPTVTWRGGTPNVEQKPRLFWQRVSPFDLWWTPGVSNIEDASVIEKQKFTRADLNDLLDLPGYNTDEIRAVLDEYGRGGLVDGWDGTDAERAVMESKENPQQNRSGLMTGFEWHGNVQGRMLREFGMDKKQVPDDMRDYMVQAWLIGTHVIKVQMTPSPRKRHPYFITSFEKVPGTVIGNALPDILNDVQDVANATLRALVNNMSISSGPQVVINYDRLHPSEDGEELYPWKRWAMTTDPIANNTQVPVSFFQPVSNAQELLTVYARFNDIADELSAIPKHLSGSSAGGGAGRTASGLAMLMNNAAKILQTVAANVDRDVIDPALTGLYDMIMLTDETGIFTGDESIRVMGVNVAIQRETQRARQIEFLTATANPIDMSIMGIKGRAAVLRPVAQTIGLDGEKVVPSEDEIEAKEQAAALMQPPPDMAEAGAQAQGTQTGPTSTNDMGPRTNLQQQKPAPTVAGGVG